MEHGGGTNASAEVLGLRCNGQQRLGRAEPQVVDHCLVVVEDCANPSRYCEGHVEVADRQQIGIARRKPILRCRALTLWAMAVAT